MARIISWFSCGAASAVATKLAIATGKEITIAYCEVKEEHSDNMRFLRDCEKWFGQEILILGNDKYNRSIYEVFRQVKYIKGNNGAPCTRLLKKQVREDFQRADDIQIIGYTVEEWERINQFIDANNEVDMWPILQEKQLTKQDCFAMIANAGIELPEMYKLGYKNNNCIGCVKGGKGYWNKIRTTHIKEFWRMAELEEEIGASICYTDIKKQGSKSGKNEKTLIPLRDLDPDAGCYESELSTDCGIFCLMAEQDISASRL